MATKLMEREGWEHKIFENIDWQSRATAILGMKDNDKKQIFKMTHGALPVMRQQERFGYSNTTTCLVCKSEEETITHMLRCQILTNPEWTRDIQTALKTRGRKKSKSVDVPKSFLLSHNWEGTVAHFEYLFLVVLLHSHNSRCP